MARVSTSALFFNTTGGNNIGLGFGGGANLTTGSNKIAVGNPGVAGEGGTIRIGTAGTQTRAFIAGIRGPPEGETSCTDTTLNTLQDAAIVRDQLALRTLLLSGC